MIRIGKMRAIRDDELELMLSWRNAPNVRKNMYTQHVISLEEHLAWWDSIKNSACQKYFMFEADNKPYGVVAFTNIDLKNNNSTWAFYASPDAIIGIGSRMELLALDYAFSELNLHKLNCEVLAFNTSVINLHKKFGFKIEGVLRQQYIRELEYIDVYHLGILSTEWAEKRATMFNKLINFLEK